MKFLFEIKAYYEVEGKEEDIEKTFEELKKECDSIKVFKLKENK